MDVKGLSQFHQMPQESRKQVLPHSKVRDLADFAGLAKEITE